MRVISTKKLGIIWLAATLSALFLMYAIFIMPLPFIGLLWERDIARDRMAESVSMRVIGLTEQEVIDMLGTPASILYPPWHGVAPGLDYVIQRRGRWRTPQVLLIVHFNADMFAYRTSRYALS